VGRRSSVECRNPARSRVQRAQRVSVRSQRGDAIGPAPARHVVRATCYIMRDSVARHPFRMRIQQLR
jgi:hypothetical protein